MIAQVTHLAGQKVDVEKGRLAGGPPPSPRQMGQRLFEALLSGPVRSLFDQSQGRVESTAERGLRVRLHFDPEHPDLVRLASLPWEFLYWRDRDEFLSLSRFNPVVRHLSVARPARTMALRPPLRILVAVSPTSSRPLDLERERRGIDESWGGGDEIEVVFVDPVTPESLVRELARGPFHVLHFMGHGDFSPGPGEGALIFNDERGEEKPVTGAVLADLLRDRRELRLVLLNACDSARATTEDGRDPFAGVATALVKAGMPAVVAMQFPISDQAAIAFSAAFYGRLAAGRSLEAATAAGRQAILSDNVRSLEWGTPVLFLRASPVQPPPARGRSVGPSPPQEDAGKRHGVWPRSRVRILALVGPAILLLLLWLLGYSAHRARESLLGMEPLEYPDRELLIEGTRAAWLLPWRGLGALFLGNGVIRICGVLLFAVTLFWLGPLRRWRLPAWSFLSLSAVSALLLIAGGAFYTVVVQSAQLAAGESRSESRCGTSVGPNLTDRAAFEVCSWLENDSRRNDDRRQSLAGLLFWLLAACAATATTASRRTFGDPASRLRWTLVALLVACFCFLLARLPLTHAYATWGIKYPVVEAVLAKCDGDLAEKIKTGTCTAFDVSAGALETMLLVRGPCDKLTPLESGCVRNAPGTKGILSFTR